jgi:hypothetical protein
LQQSAGDQLQRIHLGATSDGIALQHMNQITERIDREQILGLPPTFATPGTDASCRPPAARCVPSRPCRAGARLSPRRPLVEVTR